jgi:hypothetical protein
LVVEAAEVAVVGVTVALATAAAAAMEGVRVVMLR